MRAEIAETYEELAAMLQAPAFRAAYPQGIDRTLTLKTTPRGISVDHQAIEFLRLTSFVTSRPCSDEALVSAGFDDELLQSFKAQYGV